MTRSITLTVFAVAILATGCAGGDPVAPDVRPLVDAIERADSPARYRFNFVPASPSPFVACLAGVDEIEGVLDVGAGAIRLQPRREAPEILVTTTELLVARAGSESWMSTPWDPAMDGGLLAAIFGETMAGRILVGFRSPDPNAIAMAAIDIADSVVPASTPRGSVGESLEIVVNQREFADRTGDLTGDAEDGLPPPLRLIVSATQEGLVTSIFVNAGPDGDSTTNYAISASYDDIPRLVIPSEELREATALEEVEYPDAQSSCAFGQ